MQELARPLEPPRRLADATKIAGTPKVTSYTYDVFISYSHSGHYRTFARALQRSLHAFARPWYKLRAIRSYRDETNISATPDLWEAIKIALESSKSLLVLASPEAAQSPWVTREIKWWLENRGPERLIIAVLAGSFQVDPQGFVLDPERTDCLSREIIGALPALPLLIDLKEVVSDPVRHTMADSVYRDGVQRLAASIHDKALDEIAGEDIRQQRIRKRIAATTALTLSVLFVLAVAGFWAAVEAYLESRHQRSLALLGEARALATDAERTAIMEGDGTRATLLAAASLKRLRESTTSKVSLSQILSGLVYNPSDHPSREGADQLWTDTREAAIARALYRAQRLPVQRHAFSTDFTPTLPVENWDPVQKQLYVAHERQLFKFDLATHPSWRKLDMLDLLNQEHSAIAANSRSGIIASATWNGGLSLHHDGKVRPEILAPQRDPVHAIALDRDARFMITGGIRGTVKVWPTTGTIRSSTIIDNGQVGEDTIRAVKSILTSDNGLALVVPRSGPAIVLDLAEKRLIAKIRPDMGRSLIVDGAISSDGRTAAIRTLGGEITLTELPSGRLLRRLYTESGGGALSLSADGRLVIGLSDAIMLQDVATGAVRERLSGGNLGAPRMLRFSHDGSGILAAFDAGRYAYFAFPSNSSPRVLGEVVGQGVDHLVADRGGSWVLATRGGALEAYPLGEDGNPATRVWTLPEKKVLVVAPRQSEGEWFVIGESGRTYQLVASSNDPQPGHDPFVSDVVAAAIAMDSMWWVLATKSGDVQVRGTIELDFSINGEPTEVVASARTDRLAILTSKRVLVFTLGSEGQQPLLDQALDEPVSAVFSRDGKRLAVGLSGGSVAFFELDNSTRPIMLHPHVSRVSGLQFDSVGERIATVSFDGTAALSRITGVLSQVLEGKHGVEAARIALNEARGLIATGGEDGRVLIRHITSGALVQEHVVRNGLPVNLLFVGSDLLIGDDNGRVTVIPVGSFNQDTLHPLSMALARKLTAYERGIARHEGLSEIEVACKDAIVRTSDPRSVLSGIVLEPHDYRGQATLCRRAAEAHPDKPCWKREAGLIIRRYAISRELLNAQSEAIGPREEAYALTEEAAAAGCLAAQRDLADVDEKSPAAKMSALNLYRQAAERGDRAAAAAVLRLRWETAAEPTSRERLRAEIESKSSDGDPWMGTALAALLADEDFPSASTDIFRFALRASLVFDHCEHEEQEHDRSIQLRAAAFGLLPKTTALSVMREEQKKVRDLISKRGDALCRTP